MEKQKRTGFTLVEIVIYAGLLSVVLLLTTNFLYQVINFKLNHQVATSLFQNSFFALNKISQDVRRANSLISPVDADFTDSLVLETEAGQIDYQIETGTLMRNDQALTDEKVIVILSPPETGFRKIGQSVQVKMKFRTNLKPFGQPAKEVDYQTTISLGE